jgi:N-acetylmuramoyl-L-alanine amidase
MRYLRALCFVFCALAFINLYSAGKRPSDHSVQGSYELSSADFMRTLKPLIILDAGHGGTDEGAKVSTFMEKRVTLVTTLLIKKHLEELGYRVILTRSRDIYLPLQRRVSIANKTKGSLFVSVHFNSSPSVDAQGIEIFYYDSKEAWRARASKRLANCILHHTIDQTAAVSRGVKQGNFHVIRETDMPSVLVEGGFITNREERGKLRDKAYLERLSVGIAQGIDKYMKM